MIICGKPRQGRRGACDTEVKFIELVAFVGEDVPPPRRQENGKVDYPLRVRRGSSHGAFPFDVLIRYGDQHQAMGGRS